MTTLYRPILIESVEQAEALGWKTPIHIVLACTQEVRDVRLFEDFAEDFWPDALEPGNRWVYVALVPIEAEEEAGKTFPPGKPETTHFRVGGPEGVRHLRDGMDVTDEVDAWEATRRTRTRYVTPWEEQS